jgi:hypothetical protein
LQGEDVKECAHEARTTASICGRGGGPGMDLVLEAMLLGGASIDALRVVAEAVL